MVVGEVKRSKDDCEPTGGGETAEEGRRADGEVKGRGRTRAEEEIGGAVSRKGRERAEEGTGAGGRGREAGSSNRAA